MKRPRTPLSKEAREHLLSKLDRMKGIEKKKTIKRLEMYDRGFEKRDYYKSDKEKLEYEKE